MTGHARAMLYRLAVETGLRAGELRSLTRSSFVLDAEAPTVTVGAAYSKRRREDTLPIRPEFAVGLTQFLADKLPTTAAFKMPDPNEVAKMMRADLTSAGILCRDDTGRVVDFHALRHTFITNLTTGGTRPKVAQTLARHSTITLTMDRYSHQFTGDERAALAVLPELSLTMEAKATGADNATINATLVSNTSTSRPTSSSAESAYPGANRCDEGGKHSQLDVRLAGCVKDDGAATSCDSTRADANKHGEAGRLIN